MNLLNMLQAELQRAIKRAANTPEFKEIAVIKKAIDELSGDAPLVKKTRKRRVSESPKKMESLYLAVQELVPHGGEREIDSVVKDLKTYRPEIWNFMGSNESLLRQNLINYIRLHNKKLPPRKRMLKLASECAPGLKKVGKYLKIVSTAIEKKRTVSPELKARLSAIQKARWDKIRAEKKHVESWGPTTS